MRIRTIGLIALSAYLVISWAPARADEQKVPLDQVPRAVLQAAHQHFPGAKLTSAEKETEKGMTQYEIALTHHQQKLEATFTADGTLILIERQIAAADLPAVVRRAVKAKYAHCTLRGAEEQTRVRNGKRTLASYEVQITTQDNKKREVVVTPKGKIQEDDKD